MRRIGLRKRLGGAARRDGERRENGCQLHGFPRLFLLRFFRERCHEARRREKSALLSLRWERPALAGTPATPHRCRSGRRGIRMRSTTIACAAAVLALGAWSVHAQPTASTAGNIVVETVAK